MKAESKAWLLTVIVALSGSGCAASVNPDLRDGDASLEADSDSNDANDSGSPPDLQACADAAVVSRFGAEAWVDCQGHGVLVASFAGIDAYGTLPLRRMQADSCVAEIWQYGGGASAGSLSVRAGVNPFSVPFVSSGNYYALDIPDLMAPFSASTRLDWSFSGSAAVAPLTLSSYMPERISLSLPTPGTRSLSISPTTGTHIAWSPIQGRVDVQLLGSSSSSRSTITVHCYVDAANGQFDVSPAVVRWLNDFPDGRQMVVASTREDYACVDSNRFTVQSSFFAGCYVPLYIRE